MNAFSSTSFPLIFCSSKLALHFRKPMALRRAHEAEDYELQSRGLKTTLSQDNDEQQLDVLNRLGKLPVLKVSPLSWLKKRRIKLTFVAQLRLPLDLRLYMQPFGCLGSCLDVRRDQLQRCSANTDFFKHIQCVYLQVSLAKGSSLP